MAEDRAYDPKRRPNIFYKNDPASDKELIKRSVERGQHTIEGNSVEEHVSNAIGFDKGKGKSSPVSARVSKDGKKLSNIYESKSKISNGTSENMPISGTRVGKVAALINGSLSKKVTRKKD